MGVASRFQPSIERIFNKAPQTRPQKCKARRNFQEDMIPRLLHRLLWGTGDWECAAGRPAQHRRALVGNDARGAAPGDCAGNGPCGREGARRRTNSACIRAEHAMQPLAETGKCELCACPLGAAACQGRADHDTRLRTELSWDYRSTQFLKWPLRKIGAITK